MRRGILHFLRGAIATWLCTLLLAFQAHTLDSEQPAPHPIVKLLQAGSVRIETTSISVGARLANLPPYDLGSWKALLQGTVRVLEQSGGDLPLVWELIAEENGGYRALRYEGRGRQGTHWVLSAYQMGADEGLYVTLRSELRGFPEDLRYTAYRLEKQLRHGVGQPLQPVATRIAVTGRTDAQWGDSAADFAERLLQSVGASGALRVKERTDALWVLGYTPFLAKLDGEPSNIELQLLPEGDQMRVTLGTPFLGSVESSLATGGTFAYTPAATGQTILTR